MRLLRHAFALTIVFAAVPVAAATNEGRPGQPYRTGLHEYVAARFAIASNDLDGAAQLFNRALRYDRDDLALRSQTFELALAAGDYDDALDLANTLAKTQITSSLPQLMLAAQSMRASNWKRASEQLGGMGEAGFEQLIAPLLRAWAAAGQGDSAGVAKALDTLESAGAFRGYLLEHRLLLAVYAKDKVAIEAALKAFGDTLPERPARVRVAAAAAFQQLGDVQAARAALGLRAQANASVRLLAAHDALDGSGSIAPLVTTPAQGAAEALYRTAADISRERPLPVAISFAQIAAYLRPDLSEASILVADLLRRSEQFSTSKQILDRIPQDDPLRLTALISHATLLAGQEQFSDALKMLEAEEPRWTSAYDFWVTKGDVLRRMDKFPEASAAYTKAITQKGELASDDWYLLYLRGISYERAKNWPPAEADFKRALELKPDQPDVLNYLGYTWLEQGRNLAQARQLIQKAVDQRPDDGYIIDSLGWAYFVEGDFENAVKHLETAVATVPGDPTINDHLGDAYWKLGREREARFRWQAALDSNPSADQRKTIEAKMDAADPAAAMVKFASRAN
jgi:tetratricopeptide (TPR) repeat protein